MPAASPQAPKPQTIAASTSRIAPMFIGTLAAGLDFDTRADPSTIIAAQRSVNALPIITTTAEAVTPAERGIVYLRSRRVTYHSASGSRKRFCSAGEPGQML